MRISDSFTINIEVFQQFPLGIAPNNEVNKEGVTLLISRLYKFNVYSRISYETKEIKINIAARCLLALSTKKKENLHLVLGTRNVVYSYGRSLHVEKLCLKINWGKNGTEIRKFFKIYLLNK